MLPTRLYGALPHALVSALLLLAILILAFVAHAEAHHEVRHAWHCHHDRMARHGRRVIGGIARQARVDVNSAAEISVFGHAISTGFGLPKGSPFGDNGFSLDTASAFSQSRVADIVRARAQALGVPVRLALAITRYESGRRCAMHGRAGERGAMQVLPQTARSVGVTGNLEDCATGIEAGLRYLRLALSMHAKAGWCAVASAYNSGTFRESRCTPYGRTIAVTAGMP